MTDHLFSLRDKTALVTGGSRGIGRAIVECLAAAGAHVAFSYVRSAETAKDLVENLQAQSYSARAYASDASCFQQAKELVEVVYQERGGIDMLINNAGITCDRLLLRMSEADWSNVLSVNLTACFNTVRAATPVFVRQRSGAIVNMSSIVGLYGQAGQANYAAAKAGVIGFTKSVARELGPRNVRANVVAPGLIQTDMTSQLNASQTQHWIDKVALRRAGDPCEIARCVLFLCSDAASYITGQVIGVDGGI